METEETQVYAPTWKETLGDVVAGVVCFAILIIAYCL